MAALGENITSFLLLLLPPPPLLSRRVSRVKLNFPSSPPPALFRSPLLARFVDRSKRSATRSEFRKETNEEMEFSLRLLSNMFVRRVRASFSEVYMVIEKSSLLVKIFLRRVFLTKRRFSMYVRYRSKLGDREVVTSAVGEDRRYCSYLKEFKRVRNFSSRRNGYRKINESTNFSFFSFPFRGDRQIDRRNCKTTDMCSRTWIS